LDLGKRTVKIPDHLGSDGLFTEYYLVDEIEINKVDKSKVVKIKGEEITLTCVDLIIMKSK